MTINKKTFSIFLIGGLFCLGNSVLIFGHKKPNTEQIPTIQPDLENIYGRLVNHIPVYAQGKLDYHILTVTQHQLHPDIQATEKYLYLDKDISQTSLLNIAERDNYCLKFVVDNTHYPQVFYRIVKKIELIQKNCE